MPTLSRPAGSIALGTGAGWLALVMLTGVASAAQPYVTPVADRSQVAQLENASVPTSVQAPQPSAVDGVSRAMEDKLDSMVPGLRTPPQR